METKYLALSLVKKFGTRDPYKICEYLDYIIYFAPLHDMKGYYHQVQRNKIICINSNLDEFVRTFTCAHELGHSLLGENSNKFFLARKTHFYLPKYEVQADRFAVDLLFDDYDLQSYLECPITTASSMGVSLELAAYRMGMVKPRLFPEW
ncbi:MAG: ImmA/IrrE family metallo-endopeptidase [Oscillospiraceae bacterium]|nr:ImmA/IrrE family metallo-endopeptidase [Oscillospiraceae bacterium]MCL2279450.1 ImmA/IrrE family metallo-endopeptidase [Oscillospiraceae bacterium]